MHACMHVSILQEPSGVARERPVVLF